LRIAPVAGVIPSCFYYFFCALLLSLA